MQFPPVGPEPQNMPQVLEQGAAVHPHGGYHPQRQQGNGHHHHPDHAAHGDPQQLRRPHQQQKEHRFHGVPGVDHAAQQLAGIGVVCRDGVDVADLFFLQGNTSSLCFAQQKRTPRIRTSLTTAYFSCPFFFFKARKISSTFSSLATPGYSCSNFIRDSFANCSCSR